MESDDARESLDAIAAGRQAAADRLVTPGWYHPMLGGLVALLVVVVGLTSPWVLLGFLFVYGVGIGALMQTYRRRAGVWVWGFGWRKANWWAHGLALVLLICVLGAMFVPDVWGVTWPVWALAGVAFVATVLMGRRFDRAMRVQMRAGR